MKKLVFILAAIFALGITQEIKASHIAGGEIFYEYIGDSTGIPYHYCVTVYIYRDNEGATLGNTVTIEASSSCYSSVSFTANQITEGSDGPNGSYLIPTLNECADAAAVAPDRFVQHIYKECVILPGPCGDWKFGVAPPCCKNGDITNLADLANSYYMAKLNNLHGDNSSPVFLEPAAKAFCQGRLFNWSQRGKEPDGDSLYYTFGHPLDGPDELLDTIPFSNGHSREEPMLTENGITVDNASGVFSFTAKINELQFAVIKVVIREYRFDSTALTWYLVGESMRELQIPVVDECRSDAQNGPIIQTDLPNFSDTLINGNFFADMGIDSLKYFDEGPFNDSLNVKTYNIPVVDGYACYDSSVTLVFSYDKIDTTNRLTTEGARVQCSSIDPTDFRVIGPDTVPRPVIAAYGTGCLNGDIDTDSIILVLERPLDVNGNYFLYTKRGNDGNTLQNVCGFELAPFSTIMIRVRDCPPLIYNVENVSVEEDEDIRVDWHIDSAYFAKGAYKVFTGWQILRRKGGTQEGYYGLVDGLLRDIDARTYLDTSLDDYAIDGESWEYAIQLFQNGYYKPSTEFLESILLEDSLMTTSNLELNWNEYKGWENPWYQLYTGSYDTASGTVVAWDTLGKIDTNYYSYDYTLPSEDSLGVSYFAVKVEASSDDPAINYVSESNWIYYGREPVPEDTIPIVGDPVFPNIFTPNNDGTNDVFYVKTNETDVHDDPYRSLKDYPKVELSVYNRWGKLVFEDMNFAEKNNPNQGWDGTDMNSGQKLADGVYYYTVTLTDPETYREEQHKGSVTIISNGTN